MARGNERSSSHRRGTSDRVSLLTRGSPFESGTLFDTSSGSYVNILLLSLLACPSVPTPGERADSGSRPKACLDAEEILDAQGSSTGFVRCPEGGVDRIGDWNGSPSTYADTYGEPWVEDGSDPECESDDDCPGDTSHCVQKDLGACVYHGPRCEVSCSSNADCGAGELCVPPEAHEGWFDWPTCIPATCESGDDCDSGECALLWENGNDGLWLACRTNEDVCRENSQCPSATAGTCALSTCADHSAC